MIWLIMAGLAALSLWGSCRTITLSARLASADNRVRELRNNRDDLAQQLRNANYANEKLAESEEKRANLAEMVQVLRAENHDQSNKLKRSDENRVWHENRLKESIRNNDALARKLSAAIDEADKAGDALDAIRAALPESEDSGGYEGNW